ncbi:hypothetical protein PGT21_014752 [Puccinia graminis f. sp. tritici]|uniref:Small nuclear ribonucleoprotein Prp3 C-terminal domain-containing protein n=1 Tax=Puccinia graminis f. sp. tritici TaxID=56615 RepID=A0A5B0LYR9_PUCGR|nr:hypothetical protein PGT21_014752 [Puccinia graminis f. sp. tritici]
MHHIKATGKRKNIVAWARELGIRGWSKPGYPGALIIDGPKTAVEEYSQRLKALRWKAIQQRHFEVYQLPASSSPISPSTTQIVTGSSSSFNQDHQEEDIERHRRIRMHLPPGAHLNNEDTSPDAVFEVHSMAHLLLLARASGFDDQVLQILKIK